MPKLSNRIPAYARHKASGQAVVNLDGRSIYLGSYDTPASREKYNRVLAEWIANGRHLPIPAHEITVVEVIDRFREHAQAYYRTPDGDPGEWTNFAQVLHQLRLVYARTPAAEFGPLSLKALRERLIREHEIEDKRTGKPRIVPGWARTTANRGIARVQFVYKWAVSEELVPAHVHEALSRVGGLLKGKTIARETDPVRPVPEANVFKTLPFLSRQLAAVAQLQLLTGARGGEILIMRPCDIDRSRAVWFYVPARHKTAHKGIAREIAMGAQAKKIVEPFLSDRSPAAFMFTPAEAEAERRAKRTAQRKVKAGYGNCVGTNVKATPKRRPGEVYNNRAYAAAVRKAAGLANVPHWHPHQLRHTAATNIRREFGIDAARAMLGHTSEEMTNQYAERDRSILEKVAAAVG